MAKAKEKKKVSDYQLKEIQEAGNILLWQTINELRKDLKDVFWRQRSQEDQTDKGIDFEYELEDKKTRKTIHIFKIQNKGVEKELKPLTTTVNKGLISFVLKVRHARYFRYEIPVPLIFTVCDLQARKVYWHAVQLDDSIDGLAAEAEKNNQDHIRIYIHPGKYLSSATVKSFMEDVDKSYRAQSLRFQQSVSHELLMTTIGITTDHSKPLIEQLYSLFTILYKEVNYIPIKALIKLYPFRKETNYRPSYSAFTVKTDNNELIALFEKTKVVDGEIEFSDLSVTAGVTDAAEKMKMILAYLQQNVILAFTDNARKKHIGLPSVGQPFRTTPETHFDRMELEKMLPELDKKPIDKGLKNRLAHAFLQYQAGNFLRAAGLFKEIARNAKQTGQDSVYFICQFNLSKLIVFIRNHYWGKDAPAAVLAELRKIDISDVAAIHTNKQNEAVIKWIATENFYTEAKDQVSRIVEKIKEVYANQLGGGWNSGYYIDELSSYYAELDQFINSNYLIYDNFREFIEVTETFVEGLFASYAMGERQAKLKRFDDWLLHKMVRHCRTAVLRKLCLKYKIRQLSYLKSADGDDFISLLNNMLCGYPKLRLLYQKHCEKENRHFWNRYNTIFSNLLFLTGMMDLPASQVKEIAHNLREYLKNESFLNADSIDAVSEFLYRKAAELGPGILKGFVTDSTTSRKLHNEDFLERLPECFRKTKGTLTLSGNEFDELMKIFGDRCPVCESPHTKYLITYYYDILSDAGQKLKLSSIVSESLRKKFLPELYYFAALFDVIPFDQSLFDQLKEYAKPNDKKVSLRQVFTGFDDHHSPDIDLLINLGFKYEMDLGLPEFDDFRNLNDYYDWLLNMSSFDYNNFDVQWLTEYETVYYLNEFKKHPSIKDALEKYLSQNADEHLHRIYFELYANPAH